MSIEKYRTFMNYFKLNEKELAVFLLNYYDSIVFNSYLSDDYIKFDFNSTDRFEKLTAFFDENNVDERTRKRIVISTPLIFSCSDFSKELRIIYLGNELEGIVICDKNNISHSYRIKNNLRSIVENSYLASDMLVTESEKTYRKNYYIKK